MRVVVGVGAILLAPVASHAFCGAYVGEPGAELISGASQVVLAREGDRTVLTLTNDVEGSVKDFAMLIPVPEVLGEEDVAVLDSAIVERVQEYAGPRLVRYECSDFYWGSDGYGGSSGCSGLGCTDQAFTERISPTDASGSGGQALDVTVEAEFAAGEYDIVILSSEDSADLLTWLDREGYGISPDTESLLGEYIDAESMFLAAKVRLDDVPTTGGVVGRPYLSPLQLTYESAAFSLPIRLGTVNSPGTQDLIVYTLTDAQEGSVGIANYDQGQIESECMFDEARLGSLDAFMGDQMDEAVAANDGAAWIRTYSWQSSKCDPCPEGGALEGSVVQSLGFQGDATSVHVTRLWMRYDADAAQEDVVMYTTGDASWAQLRYIEYVEGLEMQFPVCGEGWVDDPASCADEVDDGQQSSLGGWAGLGFFGLLAGLGLGLRRRR